MNQVAGTLPSSGQMLLAWKIINKTICIQGNSTISLRLSSPKGSACGEGSVVTKLIPPEQTQVALSESLSHRPFLFPNHIRTQQKMILFFKMRVSKSSKKAEFLSFIPNFMICIGLHMNRASPWELYSFCFNPG